MIVNIDLLKSIKDIFYGKKIFILIISLNLLQAIVPDKEYNDKLAYCHAECAAKGQETGAELKAVGRTKSIPPSTLYRCICTVDNGKTDNLT